MRMIAMSDDECIDKVLEVFNWNIIQQRRNITNRYLNSLSTAEKDRQLEAFYKTKGLADYKLHVSHEAITELPFYQKIDLSRAKKSANYRSYTMKAGIYYLKDYPQTNEYGDKYVPLVVYDKDVELPMIYDGDGDWMTLELFEEETMRPCVERAFGHVLVVGLGLGFFPFNALLNSSVERVAIVEKNENIIHFFEEHILPQFPRKEDVTIIRGDAYDYLNNDYVRQYDYAFVDIWRNEADGMFALSNCFKNLDFDEGLNIDFWIEDSILENVKECLLVYLIYLRQGRLGEYLRDGLPEERTAGTLIGFGQIHRYFQDKEITISTESDLVSFVNSKALLRDLLKHL